MSGVIMSEWISVKDRLPDFEVMVLVYSKDVYSPQKQISGKRVDLNKKLNGVKNGKWCWQCYPTVWFNNPTHWMPLPSPPGE